MECMYKKNEIIYKSILELMYQRIGLRYKAIELSLIPSKSMRLGITNGVQVQVNEN